REAFPSILGERDEDASLDVELEPGGRRDETVELQAIAPIELDVAAVQEATGAGVDELQPLLSGICDEPAGEHSLVLPGQTNRDSIRAGRVTEDDGQSHALTPATEHDRVEAENRALGSWPLLSLGELPRASARVVVSLADRHRAVLIAIARAQPLE